MKLLRCHELGCLADRQLWPYQTVTACVLHLVARNYR
jgi:hypothetical protein